MEVVSGYASNKKLLSFCSRYVTTPAALLTARLTLLKYPLGTANVALPIVKLVELSVNVLAGKSIAVYIACSA